MFTNLSDNKVYDSRVRDARIASSSSRQAATASARTEIYNYMVQYFDYPTLVKFKDENGKSLYVAKVSSMLLNSSRYIFAVCKQDIVPLLSTMPLTNLQWISFMTRTLETDIAYAPKIKYKPKLEKSDVLTLIFTDEKTYQYSSNVFTNIKVTLLCTGSSIYPQRGSVGSALETFESVITFV